ncbi:hypothetical protein GHNINEIG_01915 [Hydrogenovibrio crunogenus]|uniref:Uncharacterized protein n=1 Tax=Hydrogenovibrio crunogenus TaxID=39765 RepID=A0A4P7P1C0_9GAMM|nr:hypothetical protein [Hydrogenovibrio crunogenus]QBZ83848.1 hypothetical protein GHNINEIG_01915 [Hydrogenovibrio crunogenus]
MDKIDPTTSLVIGSIVVLLVGGYLVSFALWMLKVANKKEEQEKRLETCKESI